MKNPLVVGYRGEIGSYILAGLIKYMPSATNILCYDTVEPMDEVRAKISKADVIFLCVPLEHTLNFFRFYQLDIRGKTVVEQTSLKSTLFESPTSENARQFLHGVNILSMHILFRPSSTPNFKDRKIALIDPVRWTQADYKEIEKFVKSLAAGIEVYSDYKIHDYDMAYQQALVHRVILCLNEALISSKCDQRTYLGERIRELSQRILSGDKNLYSMIQENPALPSALKVFKENLTKFKLEDYFESK